MKKLIGNNVVCGGVFCGPEIEEGTFHEKKGDVDVSHKNKTVPECPCPPVEFPEAKVSEASNEDNEENTGNKD